MSKHSYGWGLNRGHDFALNIDQVSEDSKEEVGCFCPRDDPEMFCADCLCFEAVAAEEHSRSFADYPVRFDEDEDWRDYDDGFYDGASDTAESRFSTEAKIESAVKEFECESTETSSQQLKN